MHPIHDNYSVSI